MAVTQPRRGAARNQHSLTETATGSLAQCLFPSLDPGLTLLDIEGGRGVPIVQSLVLDHLLVNDGPAIWVDTHGYATTTSLARLTPSQRLLARINIARAFTVYQHYSAICDLPTAVAQSTQQPTTTDTEKTDHRRQSCDGSSAATPSLIVVPALDGQYRDDETLGEHAKTLQARALARLRHYARNYPVSILLTRTATDAFAAPIERAANQYLSCELTSMGPRFVGEDFETLFYPVEGGRYYQTTFAYWRQVLATRAEQVGLPEPTSSPTPGASHDSGVGTGVRADGTTTTPTTTPLVDAWTSTGGQ